MDYNRIILIGGNRADYESCSVALHGISGLHNVYYGIGVKHGPEPQYIAIESSLGKRVIIFKGCVQFHELREEIERISEGYPNDADSYIRSKYTEEMTNRIVDAANTMARPYYSGTEIREAIENARKIAYKDGFNEHKRRLRVNFGLERDPNEL